MGRKRAAGAEGNRHERSEVQEVENSEMPGIQKSKIANVLFVDAYPKIGGGQQVLFSMTTRLNPERYRPLVALPPTNPLHDRLVEAGVRTVDLWFDESNYTMPSVRRPQSVLKSAASIVRVIRDIVKLARQEKSDIIHANSAVAGIHALPAAMLLGIPCVVHHHDFNTSTFANKLLKVLMRYPRAGMIFVARVLAEHYGVGKNPSYPWRVIYNGVDTAVFRPDPEARAAFYRELGASPDHFWVGAVGRLERWKGFDILIDAFALVAAKHPNARLVIIGDVVFDHLKDVKTELQDQVKRLGLQDKVVFAGFRADMPTVMAAIDMLAHSPIDREGFPVTLLEAMAAARPIVTVPAGGTVEQVFNGKNGYLVPSRDRKAIAEAISHVIADPALARRLGETGRRLIEERFSVEAQAAQVEQLYDLLLCSEVPKPFPNPSR